MTILKVTKIESRGQGIANIVTGFFGGMAGCAMIGQSVINLKFQENNIIVELIGLNEPSKKLLNKLTLHSQVSVK